MHDWNSNILAVGKPKHVELLACTKLEFQSYNCMNKKPMERRVTGMCTTTIPILFTVRITKQVKKWLLVHRRPSYGLFYL